MRKLAKSIGNDAGSSYMVLFRFYVHGIRRYEQF